MNSPKSPEGIGKTIQLERKLGEGGYGSVFACRDEFNKKYAVKRLSLKGSGVEHPLEVVIMTSIRHPALASAIRANLSEEYLHIFSELALCDGSEYIKRYGPLKGDMLRKTCFSLVQAVSCLHAEDIIHADIKIHNVLFYSRNGSSSAQNATDDVVCKLTDFSLAIVMKEGFPRYTRSVSTRHYKPVEAMTKVGWDKSIDIWCLGCAFYEFAYGKAPIPSQTRGGENKHDEALRREDHIRMEKELKHRHVNALVEWAGFWNRKMDSNEPSGANAYSGTPWNRVFIPGNFDSDDVYEFNDMMMPMLCPNYSRRPTSKDLLEDEYFAGLERHQYRLREPVTSSKNIETISSRLNDSIRHDNEYIRREIVRTAALVYCRSKDVQLQHDQRKRLSIWLANKIVIRTGLETNRQMLDNEKEVGNATRWMFL